ncbi:peptidase-like protein [Scytonema sp. HK-05]|nr:peptidase-like protein [Scytonema sp. HK-05]
MAGKNNKHYKDRLNFVLILCMSSSWLTTSYALPIKVLANPLHSQHFIIAKPPDERQPEAVEKGIEQIPVAQPPVSQQRKQPIESPLPPATAPTAQGSTTSTPVPSATGTTSAPTAQGSTTPAPKPTATGTTSAPTATGTTTSAPKPTATGRTSTPTATGTTTSAPKPTATGRTSTPTATGSTTSTPKPTATGRSSTPTATGNTTPTPKPTAAGRTSTPTATGTSTSAPKPTATGTTSAPTATGSTTSAPKPTATGTTSAPTATRNTTPTPKPAAAGTTSTPTATRNTTPTPKPTAAGTASPPTATGATISVPKPSTTSYPSTPTATRTTTSGRRSTSSRQRDRQPANVGSPLATSITPTFKEINFVDIAFGVLAPGDYQSQGRYFHFYQFEGRENQLIQIRLTGSADQRRSNNLSLDPYLLLLDPNNQVLLKRGTGGGVDNRGVKDAFIFVRLPAKGTYKIAVTSQNPGQKGRYSIALRNDRASYSLDKSSELTSEGLTLKQNRSPYNVSKFQGKKNQLVSIRVDSIFEQFSPYIVLLNSKGQIVASDSDKDGKYSALIDRARLPEDDTYYIVVISANAQERGTYRLTLF